MRKNKNQGGFIPLLIMLGLALVAVVWFSYKHVNDAHKNSLVHRASQYENSFSQ